MTRERFIDLVKSEQEPLRRFLLSLCAGDSLLADDLAQDSLVRAYVASGKFRGFSSFRTWLFRIAYNRFIDYCRTPHRGRIPIDTGEVSSRISEDGPGDSFRYEDLYQALERIPPKERAALVLFYFEDMKIKEIASILGIPSGTVKYLLSKGRTHLKEQIDL